MKALYLLPSLLLVLAVGILPVAYGQDAPQISNDNTEYTNIGDDSEFSTNFTLMPEVNYCLVRPPGYFASAYQTNENNAAIDENLPEETPGLSSEEGIATGESRGLAPPEIDQPQSQAPAQPAPSDDEPSTIVQNFYSYSTPSYSSNYLPYDYGYNYGYDYGYSPGYAYSYPAYSSWPLYSNYSYYPGYYPFYSSIYPYGGYYGYNYYRPAPYAIREVALFPSLYGFFYNFGRYHHFHDYNDYFHYRHFPYAGDFYRHGRYWGPYGGWGQHG
jgi:hypothetical protein